MNVCPGNTHGARAIRWHCGEAGRTTMAQAGDIGSGPESRGQDVGEGVCHLGNEMKAWGLGFTYLCHDSRWDKNRSS